MKAIITFSLAIFCFFACTKAKSNSSSATDQNKESRTIPAFSSDSAFSYIDKQVSFGPRVPNTQAHVACGEYLVEKLRSFSAELVEQKVELKAFDGTILKAMNIIASFQPEKKNRILLFAHWDTRPWADQEQDLKFQKTPILGANDGASGVGVLLEIARHLGQQPTNVGIDIIFFDAEDYGAPAHLSSSATENSWCLGAQYWGRNPHKTNYSAKYGILLDMVGAPGASFYREYFSDHFAPNIVNKVWDYARNLGLERYFVNQRGGAVTDDHYYVNTIAGIPSINIIQYDTNTASGFGNYWHTQNDNMDAIDKNTLHSVGTTLLYVIYGE